MYKLRVGDPNGVALRWTGTALTLDNSAGNAVVYLGANQSSYFALPMTIGASGGIWHATGGTFAAPQGGLKIWNNSGVGTLQVFNAGGTISITLDSTGLKLPSSSSFSSKNINEVTFLAPAGTLISGVDSQQQLTGVTATRYTGAKFYLRAFDNEANEVAYLKFASSLYTGGTAVLHGANGATIQSGASSLLMSNDANAYLTGILNVSSNAVISGGLSVSGTAAITGNLSTSGAARISSGLLVGYTDYITVNRGQIVSDFAGEHDYNALVLKDSGDIAHGMTAAGLVGTETWGILGKSDNAGGGMKAWGFSEATNGLFLGGFNVVGVTGTHSGAAASIYVGAFKRSGAGPNVTAFADNENLFCIANNNAVRLILKGNGDLYLDGSAGSYDIYNDVALLRATDLALAGHDINREYDNWMEYNRADLERLGLIDGKFVNFSRMQRLITGAIHQLNQRLSKLEDQNG